jgi:ATP-dependent DNA helicase RecQ
VFDEPCGRCDNCDAGRSTPVDQESAAFLPGRPWGTVLGREDGRLTVVFDEVGYKELLEQTVLGENLLQPVTD